MTDNVKRPSAEEIILYDKDPKDEDRDDHGESS